MKKENEMRDKIYFEDMLNLFESTCKNREWGEYAYIELYGDGSGAVYSSDDDELFSFADAEELVERLKE